MTGIRIGQLRVLPRECELSSSLTSSGHDWVCYGDDNGDWTLDTEDASDFGAFRPPANSNATVPFLFNGINGTTGAALPASGAVAREREMGWSWTASQRTPAVFLAPSHSIWLDPRAGLAENQRVVQALVDSKFIDLRTRAVFVDLAVFNPVLDMTTQVRIVAEMEKGGGVLGHYDSVNARSVQILQATALRPVHSTYASHHTAPSTIIAHYNSVRRGCLRLPTTPQPLRNRLGCTQTQRTADWSWLTSLWGSSTCTTSASSWASSGSSGGSTSRVRTTSSCC